MSDRQRIFGQSKLLNHPQKIANWLAGSPRTLITAEIDLTNRCNNVCPGCAGGREASKAELTKAEVQRVFEDLRANGAEAVIFTGGGEPLLHRDVGALLHRAHDFGFDVGLITNGLALTPALAETVLATCAWVRISLDANSAEMYRQTHGVDQFEAVTANVRQLVQSRNGSGCTIGLGYLTSRKHVDQMEGFLAVAESLGVDYAQFRPRHGDLTPLAGYCRELQRTHPVMTASWQKYGHLEDLDKRPYGDCYGRFFATVIGADANVYVCCHMRGMEQYALGNLRQESFSAIWARRHEMRIDFADCPYFCRCDEFNRLTWEIKQPKQHVNFL